MPESERVRKWIEPTDGAPQKLAELIAYNRDECAWITLNGDWKVASVARKPPTFPILKALVELYQQTKEGSDGVISRKRVKSLLRACDPVLAKLLVEETDQNPQGR